MAELSQLETDSRLALRDGRILNFRKYGDAAGEPVFYFHGFPGSRLEARLADRIATRLGIRIIAIDRPGMGSSSFQPNRQILDMPLDIQYLADALRLNEFSVLGVSGGGPYAAACALKLPSRLKKVILVSGLGPSGVPETASSTRPLQRIAFQFAARSPGMIPFWFSPVAGMALRNPRGLVERYSRMSAPVDREVLKRAEVRDTLAESWGESVSSGTQGLAWELGLYAQPWGFRLEDIPVHVDLWQGDADPVVPLAMAQHQARLIPRNNLTVVPGAGHFSLIIDHCEQILKGLVG